MFNKRFKYLILFIVFFYAGKTFCKDFPMQHYTVENGLPSNRIYSIYRDHQGFLWLATDKGVVKYNGIMFEKFTTDDGIPDNDVFYFQEDYEGRLWICCYNGDLCFYKDGVFHTAANTPFLRLPYKHSFADKISLEYDSSVTFTFDEHKYVLNIHGNNCESFILKKKNYLNEQKPPLYATKISVGRYTIVWPGHSVTIDTACNIIDSNKRKYDGYGYCFIQNKSFFFTPGGIFSEHEDTLLKFTNPAIKSIFINRVTTYDNKWFIATNDGLYINNDIQLFKGDKINGVVQDIEGNYWVSSFNNGLYYLPKNFLGIAQYNDVYRGTIKYARSLDQYLFFTNDSGNFYRFENGTANLLFDYTRHLRSLNKKINKNEVDAVSQGKLVDNKFQYYSLEYSYNFILENVAAKTQRLRNIDMRTWYGSLKEVIDGGDTIYIHSSFGICALKKTDLNNNLFGKIFTDSIHGQRIYGVTPGRDNSIWFSTREKVYKIANCQLCNKPQFAAISFKSMRVAGTYMVGISNKNELVVCNNFDTNLAVSIYPNEHCIWDKIYKLSDSSFLISTDNQYRLLHLFPSPGKPEYSVAVIENDALPVQAEYICSDNVNCYFFKNGSITQAPIRSLFVTHLVPEIFFKSLKTRKNTYPIESGMVIGYNEAKNVNISFSPFSFGSKYVVCEYSISKDSTDYWRPVSNSEINLFDAGYGNYIVKIKARTLSGAFSTPYVFTFTISKPFWATWWFYTLAVVCVAGAVLLTIKRYKDNAAKENNYLQKELSALRLQMNPHFLFNTLNSIYSLSKIQSPQTPDVVYKLSELLRYVTYKSTQALTTVGEEISIIDTYVALQMVRFEGRVVINKQINIDEPETQIVPLLLLPLIENAFKHGIGMRGDNSLIDIIISLKDSILNMEVRNSITTESVKPEDYEGLGLSNTRRQLALLYKEHELSTSDIDNIFVLKLIINTTSYGGDKLSDNRR